MELLLNMGPPVLALIVALVALAHAEKARRAARAAAMSAPEARALIREIEDVLEKLANQQARLAMRKLRDRRAAGGAEEAGEPEQQPPPPPSADPKAELWAIVRGGMPGVRVSSNGGG